jgi:site-specific recombinase
MMSSAAGGGVLTAGTIALKFLTKWGHFPLFVDGFLSGANYAASFVLMQLLGLTLATKQPSMTAAALAGTIKGAGGQHRMDELVTMIARISRSQLAAAIGNVLFVIPAAVGFNAVYRMSRGHDFLDAETATKTLASFHPLESGTIPYAALTGVLLWISSLGAGWVENWAVYRRLPEAIEKHRLGRKRGRRLLVWLAHFLEHNISGFGGNISLGFLLGMTPVIGLFFGLPLDVRHVTLSTGSLTLAVLVLPDAQLSAHSALPWACAGIAVIAMLNFSVSFALALTVAFRAREVSGLERLQLIGAVLRRFITSPLEFFYPSAKAMARDALAARQRGSNPGAHPEARTNAHG